MQRTDRGYRVCESAIETIEHVIVECNDYEKYRDYHIFKVWGFIDKENLEMWVKNGHELGTILYFDGE